MNPFLWFLSGLAVGGVLALIGFWWYTEHLLDRAQVEGTEQIGDKRVTLIWEEEYKRLKECEKANLGFKEKA